MSVPLALGGLTREDLVGRVGGLGEKSFRADQVLGWFYRRRARSFEEMTDLPAGLRTRLAGVVRLFASRVVETREDPDGTRKLVVGLDDGHTIESVMIPETRRRTGCVSTQVGCPVGCRFCASGASGLERNLDAAEIVEQAVHLTHTLAVDEHLTHLVFMGIGEGLLNFDALAGAIGILNASWGLGMGARRMTVSTVGVRGTIGKLAAMGLQVNLAISLHAPGDALRRQLIPHKGLMSVKEIVDVSADYFEATGRDVTFEYVLLAGVNDAPVQAESLAAIVKPCHAAVNLIGYNPVPGSAYRAPTVDAVKRFRDVLRACGVHVTARRGRGTGVDAACGQLRRDARPRERDGRS